MADDENRDEGVMGEEQSLAVNEALMHVHASFERLCKLITENKDEIDSKLIYEELARLGACCAITGAVIREMPPSIICGEWAGALLQAEASTFSDFQDIIANIARDN